MSYIGDRPTHVSYTGLRHTFCLERVECHTQVPVIHFVWTNKIPDKIRGVIHGY